MNDFDIHKNIQYMTISHLYWNVYPYKVLVCYNSTTTTDTDAKDYWVKIAQERKQFFNNCKAFCPADTTLWKATNNSSTFSFFFEAKSDAIHFIDNNKDNIVSVHRPENENQVAALNTDRKLVLRDHLFWGKYKYCIEFKHQSSLDDEQFLDNRIDELFHKPNKNRFFYTYSKRRRLYLQRETDIFHVKIALYDKILNQTEALLKKDIS